MYVRCHVCVTCLLDVTCVRAEGKNRQQYLNMVNESLTMHWTKTCGLRLTAEWNCGERCAAFYYAKRSEESCGVRSCGVRSCGVRRCDVRLLTK